MSGAEGWMGARGSGRRKGKGTNSCDVIYEKRIKKNEKLYVNIVTHVQYMLGMPNQNFS